MHPATKVAGLARRRPAVVLVPSGKQASEPERRHHRRLSYFETLFRAGPLPRDAEEIALPISLEHRQQDSLFLKLQSHNRNSFCGLVWEPHYIYETVSWGK